MNRLRTLLALVALAALLTATALHAQTAAFSIDGEPYPRMLFDLKVQERIAAAGRNIQSLRHPGTLRNYQQEVMNRLIEERLLAGEARRSGITISEPALLAAMAATPAMPGMSAEAFREEVTIRLLISEWVQQQSKTIQASDAAIAQAMASGTRPELAERSRARHILLREDARSGATATGTKYPLAQELLARLRSGAVFADLARQYSDDASAARGGELGWFGRGQMVPEFEQAAFSAPLGQPVGPVRSVFGWHLILVEEREAPRPASDAEWRQRLQSQLNAELLATEIQIVIENKRKSAKIIVHLNQNN